MTLVVVAVVEAPVDVPVATVVGIVVGIAIHVVVVVSTAVGPHSLLSSPVDVATIGELAEHRIKNAGRAGELSSSTFHYFVSLSNVHRGR